MSLERRQLLAGAVAAAALAGPAAAFAAGGPDRYGLIGKIKAQPGKRAELIAILREGTGTMPGCLSYIVTEDAAEPDTIWVTEVWTDKAAHEASLKLPQVRAAIGKGRPLIAGFDRVAETRAAGGAGLPA